VVLGEAVTEGVRLEVGVNVHFTEDVAVEVAAERDVTSNTNKKHERGNRKKTEQKQETGTRNEERGNRNRKKIGE
jgi:hypothetical protein